MLGYTLYLFKKIQHKQDALLFYINISIVYNFLVNTHQSIKSNSQYQYEPIFWKLNSVLNDSLLSIYVLLIIYTYMVYNYNSKITNVSIVVLAYVFINTWKGQFIFLNLLKITPYNTTLFNGLLLVHPICLYLSYAYILYMYAVTKKQKRGAVEYFTVFCQKNKKFLTFSLVALVLGCWWAQQEVSWGGWWNWDPIEIIALLALLVSLIVTHLNYKHQNLIFFLRPTLFIFVITTYFVSRYDILNSIHSFALASKSQNYLEMKIIVLYGILLTQFNYFFKKNQLKRYFKTAAVVYTIFYCYFSFIILTVLYNIGLNNIGLLTTTPSSDKYTYLVLIFLLCLQIFFKEAPVIPIFILSIVAILSTNNYSAYLVLTSGLLALVFKSSFWKKVDLLSTYYRIVFLHLLLLILLFLLLLYSNVEIFFIKVANHTYWTKGFVSAVTQQTTIKEYITETSCLTRTVMESFFQKNSNFVRLLTQKIISNTNHNFNKINLVKSVCFIQNYLYFYITVLVLSGLVWFKKFYKSGIV